MKLISSDSGSKENFNQYVNQFRIEEAKRLLREDKDRSLQIYNLAIDLGYTSANSFNRVFKEAVGLTPTEFRNAELQYKKPVIPIDD